MTEGKIIPAFHCLQSQPPVVFFCFKFIQLTVELKCFALSRQDARVYRRINHVDGQRSLHTRTTQKRDREQRAERERERERERPEKQTSKLQSKEDSKGPCVALRPRSHSGRGWREIFPQTESGGFISPGQRVG